MSLIFDTEVIIQSFPCRKFCSNLWSRLRSELGRGDVNPCIKFAGSFESLRKIIHNQATICSRLEPFDANFSKRFVDDL